VGSETRTKGSHKDATDINLIVKRHAQTGLWDHLAPKHPHYGDFSQAQDLHTQIAAHDAALEDFMTLPASVRSVCNNDPVELLELLATEEGFTELIEAGLPVDPATIPPGVSSPLKAAGPSESEGSGNTPAAPRPVTDPGSETPPTVPVPT